MNIKKAEEILEGGLRSDLEGKNLKGFSEYAQGVAIGYKKAIERAKGLEEALECVIEPGKGWFTPLRDYWIKTARDALAKYRDIK